MKNKSKLNKGFTVLESIVAIFILSLSIAGVFTAVQQSLSQSIIAKDEVKAFYLAQEAVEVIRNLRDANQLVKIKNDLNHHWLNGIAQNSGDPCYFDHICRVDAVDFSLNYCGSSWDSCPALKQNQSPFLYSYLSGQDTNFKREIQIESVSTNEITVTVWITWSKGLVTREFKAKTHLFNWI